MKIFLLILLAIIFIPLPIKFSIDYESGNLHIKLFGFIGLKPSKSKEKSSKLTKKIKNSFPNFFSPKTLLIILSKNRLKPFLRVKGKLDFSLNDSAYTAIAYGVLSSIFPFLYKYLSDIFILKGFSIQIRPIFEEEFLVNLKIKCILFLSLAHVIYMIFFIIIKIIINKKKAVNPLSG